MFLNLFSSSTPRLAFLSSRRFCSTAVFTRYLFLAAFLATPCFAFARDFYVANHGSDSASGTVTAPMRTIQHAVDLAGPGSTVYVTSGTYRERINFPRSGSGGNYITVRAAGGAKAIVDAQGIPGDHIFYMWGKSYIRIQGLEIKNNLRVNDGSMIRVEGYGRHIQILDNVMYNTSGQHAMGITFYGSHPIGLSHITVRGNELYNINPGWSETMTFNGNVERFVVEHNYIHDVNNIGIDFIGGEGMCSKASRDKARNGVCRNNTVRNAKSDNEGGYAAGIYVDGGENITIENNDVSDCDLGIEVGAENPGTRVTRIKVTKNVIHNNDKSGLIFGGYERSRGRVVNSDFSNNTIYKNDKKRTGAGEICIQWASGNKIEQNIVFAGSHNVFIYSEDGNVGNSSDRNVFFSDAGSSRAQFTWAGNWAGNFARYQSLSRQDGNSSFRNPGFRNPAKGDFKVKTPLKAGATGAAGAKL